MPDLIIKPEATSGNKLILKAQDNTAVLTTSDSGATAANLTLASTTTFPAGVIVQVKNSILSTTATTSNDEGDAWVSTGLTVTLSNNLKSSSNKVLIFVNVGGVGQEHGTSAVFFNLDGVTSTATGSPATGVECAMAVNPRGSDAYTIRSASMVIEDTPATATPQAYTLQFKGSGGTCYINRPYTQDGNGGNTVSTMTVMEVQV